MASCLCFEPPHECVGGRCVDRYVLTERAEGPQSLVAVEEFLERCAIARDTAGRVTQYRCGDDDDPIGTAEYDERGNLTRAEVVGGDLHVFTYDAVDRVVTLERTTYNSTRTNELTWDGDIVVTEHIVDTYDGRSDNVFHWDADGHLLDEEWRHGAELTFGERRAYTWEGDRLVHVTTETSAGTRPIEHYPPECEATADVVVCETTFEYEGDTMVAYNTGGSETVVSANCCADVRRICGDG
jgi:YD repeat-containing protein